MLGVNWCCCLASLDLRRSIPERKSPSVACSVTRLVAVTDADADADAPKSPSRTLDTEGRSRPKGRLLCRV